MLVAGLCEREKGGCLMAVETLPKWEEKGKVPTRGHIRGTVCRKRKSFTQVMAVLFVQGSLAVLQNRAEGKRELTTSREGMTA